MSIIAHTHLTSEAQRTLDAWLDDFRTKWTELAKPIMQGDPRMTENQRAAYASRGFTPETLGRIHARHTLTADDCPISAPTWAESSGSAVQLGPEIFVTFDGLTHGGAAWVQQTFTIQVFDADATEDSPAVPAGTITTEGPAICVFEADELTATEALKIADALVSAARELQAIEEATA